MTSWRESRSRARHGRGFTPPAKACPEARRSPVTLVIALRSRDGAVLAADSQLTFRDATATIIARRRVTKLIAKGAHFRSPTWRRQPCSGPLRVGDRGWFTVPPATPRCNG